ncbi:tRNA threonylcarbamoyladenosine dehydratase [Raoultibacter phocaeensis]|uniref:tRNA threonylcarbamoyladenosine dehydratase n=1 Tax=Raoultibacter phocaeensis TaxID=2479841 RepID=UPI00111ADD2C|nr:tRNA threonylcarbamoyladenosine dehydratase [Raoultibacter phocaeensis]
MADDAQSATAKLEVILGQEGVERLRASTVMVLGLGGVGSNCVEALVRGGVGKLIVVDHDVVQASNINRQAIAFHSTIGRKKTDVMSAMIADINPSAEVIAYDTFVLAENLEEVIGAHLDELDYVVDAIDTVSTKLALARYAETCGFELISSMGAANKLHPECFRIADLYDTVNCPLCRIMRKEARKRGVGRLRVLYSCEDPVRTVAREGASRRERSDLGTASFVPPIMGQMIAGEVIRSISGIGCDKQAKRDAMRLADTIGARPPETATTKEAR